MKLYLDNCCWNRPHDGYTDQQSIAEVAAIEAIVRIAEVAGHRIYSSPVIIDEIDAMQKTKPAKWKKVRADYDRTQTDFIRTTPDIMARAQSFMVAGLSGKDHLHLAYADAAGVDFLITTDNDFIDICTSDVLSIVNVINPINMLPEVQKWAQ